MRSIERGFMPPRISRTPCPGLVSLAHHQARAARRPASRATVATSSDGSTGLARWVWKPAARARGGPPPGRRR